LLATLRGQEQARTSPIYIEYLNNSRTPNYAEFLAHHRGRQRGQMQAIRMGEYIGLRYGITQPSDPFEIYDVVKDPQQQANLADSEVGRDLQSQAQRTVRSMRRPDAEAKRPYDQEPMPAVTPSAVVPGIHWQAYAKTGVAYVPRLDDLTSIAQGTSPRPDPAVSPQPGTAILFSGFLTVAEEGVYQMALTCDGGALLRLHDATVIDADAGYHAGTAVQAEVRLQAGSHPFRLYYANHGGASPQLAWRWSRAGEAMQEIPLTAFAYAAAGK
jgi:hypothetical protein